MPTWMGWGALALLVLQGVLLIALWMRRPAAIDAEQAIHAPLRDLERALRDELARTAQATRGDMAHLQQLLLAQGGDVARTQNEQIDSFRVQLGRLQETIEARLATLQEGNERKLEQMRATVDEKLHATLEQRLSESFRQVAERLEQVHRGLGEMQTLARDVGALQRVLSNVKTRGVFGETQLAALIEEVLAPEQYARNVATLPGSSERVEFAVRLPGPRADGPPIWLPVDAKFPREDYERLVDAQERADVAAVEAAGKALEQRLRLEARRIREKYVAAPHTTDFAILFVPTEGLYAEALRRPGLVEGMQREHKIVLTGPTTLLATLSSLQMGFRTLALERRSAEVWEVLGAVKTEFGKFGDVLTRTRRKLEEATQTIDSAQQRTRAMERSLKQVEALPDAHAQLLLPGLAGGPDDAPAAPAGLAEDRPLG